jgi:DNA-binding NtrC family response regulator
VALGKTILIVDDEENLLLALRRILGKEGYQVATASNGNEALELLGKNDFRLALLDIRMFPVDGVVLLSEIKRRSPLTKVIMITAYPTADGRNECLRKGAAAYLAKPFGLQALIKTLDHLTFR